MNLDIGSELSTSLNPNFDKDPIITNMYRKVYAILLFVYESCTGGFVTFYILLPTWVAWESFMKSWQSIVPREQYQNIEFVGSLGESRNENVLLCIFGMCISCASLRSQAKSL